MNNEGLKQVYDEMHTKGEQAWFDPGINERKLILEMGKPWTKENILEIGCGKGDLAYMMSVENPAGIVWGIDYSETAILEAVDCYKGMDRLHFGIKNYRELEGHMIYDRIVMQGILEHLDNPFDELEWIINNLLLTDGDLITSSPSFVNPRGFIWMTLDMLGAVMSKTDLHFLHPWDFEKFCKAKKFELTNSTTDKDWASGRRMTEDLWQRIPLALKDGNIQYKQKEFEKFMRWLNNSVSYIYPDTCQGAVTCYRIQT